MAKKIVVRNHLTFKDVVKTEWEYIQKEGEPMARQYQTVELWKEFEDVIEAVQRSYNGLYSGVLFVENWEQFPDLHRQIILEAAKSSARMVVFVVNDDAEADRLPFMPKKVLADLSASV